MMRASSPGYRWLVLGVSLLLAACGGGDGGGGGGGGGDVTASPTSMEFKAEYGGTTPAAQVLTVGYPSGTASVIIGFPAGGTVVDWIDFEFLDTDNPAHVAVQLTDTALNPGVHPVIIRIGAVDGHNDLLGYTDVAVNYTIEGSVGASPSSVVMDQVIGAPKPSADVALSANGGVSYAWSAATTYTDGSGWLSLNGSATASGSGLPANLALGINADLGVGTYRATVNIAANGSTLEIPVTYTVRAPGLTVSPSTIGFATVSGGALLPASQSLTIGSETGVAVGYAITATYDAKGSGWLSLPANGTSGVVLGIQPNTTGLAAGTYTAQITLTPDNGATAKQVSVSYNVAASTLSSSSTSVNYTVDALTTTGMLDQTTVLSRTGGALTWAATSSAPWLSVSPAGGSSGEGENVTLSVDPSKLEALGVAVHDAAVTFSYHDAYGTSRTLIVPVSLDMRLPLFSVVTPYVAFTGRSDEIVLRGQGFNSLSGGQLRLGGTPLADFTIVNDTEVRFSHPSLAAQRYALTADNALGLARSTAELVVVDAPSYSYTAIASANFIRTLIFDPERQALYVAKWDYNHPNDRMERYAFNGATWDKTVLSLDTAQDVALTPDGRELIVLEQGTLHHVNVNTLAITRTVTDNPSGYYDYLSRLTFMSDGTGLMLVGHTWQDMWQYDLSGDGFTRIPVPGAGLYSPRVASSIDRSVVLLGENGVTDAAVFRYNPQTRVVTKTSIIRPTNNLSSDRTGNRFCIDGVIYGAGLTRLGMLPPSSASVISPSGTRAYTWESSSNKIRTFDLDSPDGSGGFTEIGSGMVLADRHGTYAPTLVVSQDGGTLFMGGDAKILIIPLE